jgi:hypothetical protein
MLKFLLSRLIYIFVGVLVGVSIMYMGCGRSGSNKGSTSTVVSAKNIIFRNPQTSIASQRKGTNNKSLFKGIFLPSAFAQEGSLDNNLQVLAENVILDTGSNSLESANLQDALDNEMAIDIPSALSGKTWLVENRSALLDLDNYQGQVTFTSSSEFTMDSGKLAFPGMWAKSADRTSLYPGNAGFLYPYATKAIVEFISNNVIWVKWRQFSDNGDSADYAAVIQVIPVNKGKFIFTGYNPVTGHYGVSTLILVE